MKVVLLRRAKSDLSWFRDYYTKTFPEGAKPAITRYRQAVARLKQMPLAGPAVPDRPIREYVIARTPFLLIYRIADDRLEILRIWDGRAERVEGWTGDVG